MCTGIPYLLSLDLFVDVDTESRWRLKPTVIECPRVRRSFALEDNPGVITGSDMNFCIVAGGVSGSTCEIQHAPFIHRSIRIITLLAQSARIASFAWSYLKSRQRSPYLLCEHGYLRLIPRRAQQVPCGSFTCRCAPIRLPLSWPRIYRSVRLWIITATQDRSVTSPSRSGFHRLISTLRIFIIACILVPYLIPWSWQRPSFPRHFATWVFTTRYPPVAHSWCKNRTRQSASNVLSRR